jgi:transcriptional regulator with XRE-family HTH domain
MAGRPTSYKAEYDEQTYKLCLLGATDKDLALFFNVQESTINNWKLKQPSFVESLKKGKMMADANVAESLYKRATGFTHITSKDVQLGDEIVTLHDEKYYAPDPVSAIFWLKNRSPEKWRDKQEIETNLNDIRKLAGAYEKLLDVQANDN